MNNKHFLLAIFLSSLISAQELDESFIKSLPEDVQKDLLQNIDTQKASESPIYRSINSKTELEKKNLENLKNRIESDLLLLEEIIEERDETLINNDELLLFGSDVFSTYQSSFMPINEPNLSSDYILDFGDTLEIQLIGQKESIDEYLIARDGSIRLKQVGSISVAGLTLNEAISMIKMKVESSFIGTEAFISLINLKDINVLVSGNAFNPGVYTIGGNSSILHALYVAGGINDFGSYREINLIRNKEIIDTLDLYDVLITGKFNLSSRLRTGDIIFVNSTKKIVSIDGALKRPAKYELTENENLNKAIEYANGISKEADLKNVYLDRILDGKVKSLPISNIKQFSNIESNDGDSIFIRKHSFRSVFVEGAVLKPGRYLMTEGESLSDLIAKTGGYTENAYPFGAVYENQMAFDINEMAKKKLYQQLIDNVITASQKNPTQNLDLTPIIKLMENLKNTEPNGRVVIDLLEESKSNSFVIRDNDKLVIPEKPSHVFIYGEVSNEGAQSYQQSKLLEYYISMSGGFNENASEEAVYILHPNGSTQSARIKKNLFQNNPDELLIIYPGSIIFVPRKIDNTATTRLAAQAYVSILGNLGIALASLSSISKD